MIARIIEQAHRKHQRFIKAQEIATQLLQDNEGRNLVEAAHEEQEDKQPPNSGWIRSASHGTSASRLRSCGGFRNG